MNNKSLSLFEAYGIELEYMIVDCETLNVLPIADKLIHQELGHYGNDVERGHIAWSNELVLHVIELKTNGPTKTLNDLPIKFLENIQHINKILANYNAMLLPTGAHPWMNPFLETKLWPHGDDSIYQAYHKIFNCQGHGWSNLQSVHLNLPFSNDDEFCRLHSAIRMLLPIIPALSASTPIIDSKPSGFIDSRLEFYRHNQKRIPSIAGCVIPEAVTSKVEYQEKILNTMYQAVSPFDPDTILQDEWLNSRGAIARFDRDAIEIRIIDTQECPEADISIAATVVGTLKKLISQQWLSLDMQLDWEETRLSLIFNSIIKNGSTTQIDDTEYLQAFNYSKASCTARELWEHILNHIEINESSANHIQLILKKGNLSERILKRLDGNFSQEHLIDVYKELANCLQHNRFYNPDQKSYET
jgi:carboxylate-amine ligase